MNRTSSPWRPKRLAFVASAALTVLLFAAGGCGQQLSTSYGNSGGSAGSKSLNGFGALRETYNAAGFQDREVRRLSERVKKTRVIVWTPQTPSPIDYKVTKWFESWFRTGSKTLVFIVPDSGSETDYWIDAAKVAPPKQRLEYRRRVAEQKNKRIQWTLNRAIIQTNGWFAAIPKPQVSKRSKLSSDKWSLATQDASQQNAPLMTEYVLEAKNPPPKSTKNTAAAVPAVGTSFGPTGPNAQFVISTTVKASDTKVSFKPLLKTESGDTVIAEITSKRWNSSRVIVVAGGSLLTNYAFTRELNRDIAEHVVQHSQGSFTVKPPATRQSPVAGFLTNSYMPISVSERKSGEAKATGVELLTVYPISLITIHGFLLGFIACMIMLPIFGRPKKVRRSSNQRFGDHLDAVATLMTNVRGERYARSRISQYMRRMKGETEGKWVLPEEPKKQIPANPVAAMKQATEDPTPPAVPTPSDLRESELGGSPNDDSTR